LDYARRKYCSFTLNNKGFWGNNRKMESKTEKNVLLVLTAAGLIVLSVFLYWHFQIGITRYFDVDEYAHLHWAAKIWEGKRPYIDYLSFFPPGFHWFLAPIFVNGWGTIQPFITARIIQFGVFAGMCIASMFIFWQRRRVLWAAILAGALLAFLPLPFDKYLEVRPDSLATLLTLLAILFQLKWMEKNERKWAIFSGVFYSLSLIVLSKMLPNVLVGAAIAVIYKAKLLRELKDFGLGLGAPVLLFGFWALSLGDIENVIYSLTKLPVEANRISEWFIMMPDLFFYPNTIYYGTNIWGRIMFANHVLWGAGCLWGIYRLLTPYLTSSRLQSKDQISSHIYSETLVALQFLVQVVFYVQLVPLKHAQYLIPIGVFVAWYGADLMLCIYNNLRRLGQSGILGFLGIYIIFSIFIYQTFLESNSPKLKWTNIQAIEAIKTAYRKVPQNEYVLDLDGRMLYNPDPYYTCCIPFGQFAGFLSRPLPSLPQALEATNTKYINQGELKRVNTLPQKDQEYIYTHFRSDSGNETLLIRNDVM